MRSKNTFSRVQNRRITKLPNGRVLCTVERPRKPSEWWREELLDMIESGEVAPTAASVASYMDITYAAATIRLAKLRRDHDLDAMLRERAEP